MSYEIPKEQVTLPSKGLIYPEGHPYSSGVVELYYMTAKSEDILNSESRIKKGTAIDDLLKHLMVDPSGFDDLVVGDKNAVLIAARILGIGSEYELSIGDRKIVFDLAQLKNKAIDESLFSNRENNFDFTMPTSGNKITFKILSHKDEQDIQKELEGLKKLYKKEDLPRTSTQLKYVITSINGDTSSGSIREYVDKALLTRDSLELRKYINAMMPDVDMTQTIDGKEYKVPMTLKFFYP